MSGRAGVLVVLGTYGLRQVVQWLTIIILAKFLAPEEMGLANMALVFSGLLMLLKDFGLGASIVYMRTASSSDLSTIYWLNLIFGVLGTIIFFSAAPIAAYFFERTEVVDFIRILSVAYLLSALSVVHQAVLEKELELSRVAQVETVATVAAAGVSVAAAVGGAGPWAAILQFVTQAAILFAGFRLVTPFVPAFVFDRRTARKALEYGGNLVGYNLFNYVARNGDYYVIGRMLGADALGIYAVAYRLIFQPVQAVGILTNRILFPILSALGQSRETVKTIYLDAIRHVAFAFFPIIGVLGIAGFYIEVVLGSRWKPAGNVIAVLAPLALLQITGATVGAVYQATGKTDKLLRWGIFSGVATVFAVVIGAQYGILGVAVAYTFSGVLLLIPGLVIPLRLISTKLVEVVAAIKWFLLGTLLLVGVTEGIYSGGDLWSLLLACAAGLLSYLIMMVIVERRFLTTIFRRMQ